MDMTGVAYLYETPSEQVVVPMSAALVAALDLVAREAGCTREAVIREYVVEGLPEGWHQGGTGDAT